MSTVIYGIDVSKHQGSIDWQRVKAAGKDFVFVRLGWCGYDGRIAANGGLDPYFDANVKGAAEAGLQVGVYVYSYATTAAAARIAAQETLSLIKNYTLTYPIVFDMEDTQSAKYNQNSKSVNNGIALAFLQTIEQGGYMPLLYTYKSFAENYLDMSALADFDFWLAQYAQVPTYRGPFTIWQSSGNGTVDGIKTAVDLNVAYKDYAASLPQPPDTKEPEPEQPTEDTFWSHLLQRINEKFGQNS